MNEEADVTYHGMGIVSFLTINGEHLMRMQDEDGTVVWLHATEHGFMSDIKNEAALSFETVFKETVDMEVHQVQLTPNVGDERPEGSYLQ